MPICRWGNWEMLDFRTLTDEKLRTRAYFSQFKPLFISDMNLDAWICFCLCFLNFALFLLWFPFNFFIFCECCLMWPSHLLCCLYLFVSQRRWQLVQKAELNRVDFYFCFICGSGNYAQALKEIEQGFPSMSLLLIILQNLRILEYYSLSKLTPDLD